MFLPVRILGTGVALPASLVTAEELDVRLNVQPGATFARNGVRTRYLANECETASALSAAAIERALEAAGLDPSALDAILYAGVLPEQPMPSTAVLIHQRLRGARTDVTCYDINASCAGFLKAFEIAASAIHAGLWRKAAVVAGDIGSKALNWEDLDTCTLFSDGAGAAILSATEPADRSGVIASRSVTVSTGISLCGIRAGGTRFNVRTPPPDDRDYYFAMNGRRLLRLIQAHLPAFLDALIADADDAGEQIAVVVPHQASAVGIAYLRKMLCERGACGVRVVDILADYGNQVSGSMPNALDHAIRAGMLQRGETALFLGTAAGLSMSGMVVRY